MNKPLIGISVLLALCVMNVSTTADTDSTQIELSHTYAPYVSFTGTAPGASLFYNNTELTNFIFPLSVNLGTMGLESNVSGLCDLNFTTNNNFKLLHTVSNQNLGDYSIQYRGATFNQANNNQLQMPCTSNATDINFILNGFSFAGFNFLLQSGVYQDVINVVVTSQ